MDKYIKVTLQGNNKYQEALLLQHHAAQFIALSGKHLIRQESDDSNTNMQYSMEKNMLIGNPLPNDIMVAIRLSDLNLCLLNSDLSCIRTFTLFGKTRTMVFEELRNALTLSGIDTSGFSDELHYQIPTHKVMDGGQFNTMTPEVLQEASLLRSNAHLILNSIIKKYNNIPEILVWPHHFDSGTIIPLDTEDSGDLNSSIGIGWAIPDSMISEPYYYLTYWRKDGAINISDLRDPLGSRWSDSEWKGAALIHSDIEQHKDKIDQIDYINDFYISGIKILTEYNNSLA